MSGKTGQAVEKDVSLLTRRSLLAGVGAGLSAFAVGCVALDRLVLPGAGRAADWRLYDYVYVDGKSNISSFVVSNMAEGSHICLGSSEFFISKDRVSTCPQVVFGEHVTGVDMTYVGETMEQSLWHCISAGAYARRLSGDRRVMLVVSPQWFFKGSGDASKFSSKFSYSLYQEFCDNPSISNETRAYVRGRVGALGVDTKQIAAANRDTPASVLDAAAYYEADQLLLRSKLGDIIARAPAKGDVRWAGVPTGEPDWAQLIADGIAEGRRRCTNNDYYVDDSFWDAHSNDSYQVGENFHEADNEYADFARLLGVCGECDLTPLVCILPIHGLWYDHCGVSGDERQAYYRRVRGLCDEAGASYMDFSSCEYERYFFYDTTHPGWVGWVRIEQSYFDFMMGRDDPFLGGGSHGEAVGLLSPDATQAAGDGDANGDAATSITSGEGS